jgi:hypothetical protein
MSRRTSSGSTSNLITFTSCQSAVIGRCHTIKYSCRLRSVRSFPVRRPFFPSVSLQNGDLLIGTDVRGQLGNDGKMKAGLEYDGEIR